MVQSSVELLTESSFVLVWGGLEFTTGISHGIPLALCLAVILGSMHVSSQIEVDAPSMQSLHSRP